MIKPIAPSRRGTIPPAGRALPPVRLESGSALLWVGALRESPPWEEMSAHVHEELRRRFLRDVLGPQEVELLPPATEAASDAPGQGRR